MPSATRALALLAVGLLAATSCSSGAEGAATTTTAVIDVGDGGDYHPAIGPSDFVAGADHPFFPLPPGARWVYEGETADGPEHDVVRVTGQHREVMGIPVVVVRDTVSDGGEVTEDTFDWYAQDRDGNVWYLGEDSTTYEHGRATGTEGSWEAGADGAQPGIIMRAHPAAGDAYRQEFLAGEAEDLAEVRDLDGTFDAPTDAYDHVLVVREWSPLEPEVVEEKYYARGVGPVGERGVAGEPDHLALVRFDPGSSGR